MGNMESKSRKRMRRGQLETAVLNAIALGGIAAVAVVAPNIVSLLKHVDPDWYSKREPKQRLREVASKLKQKGLVSFTTENGRTRMRITEKGKAALAKTLRYAPPQKPKRWDGKWRLVIFDIPERRRALRDKVRQLVAGFGFARLQDSVWAYPYDCEDVITLLKTDLRIGSELQYIIADAIEWDKPLRETFGLPTSN